MPVDPLRVTPILKVVVVREDDNWVGTPNEEVSPIFEASDDSQEFSVVDVVVSFGGVECLGVVPYGSFSSRSPVILVQYCSGGKCGGVDFQDKLFEGVGSVQDGVVKGDVDQFVDSLGVHVCP